MKSGIYKIENTVNGKCYVGSTTNLYKRFGSHRSALNKGNHCNVRLQNAWNKYGEQKFVFIIIEYIQEKEFLIQREQYWIDFLCCVNNGYNITPKAGSRRGSKLSAQAIAAMSARMIGVKRTKESLARGIKTRKSWYVMPEEVKKKISNTLKGRTITKEWREKLSADRKGRKWTPETRAKMLAAREKKKGNSYVNG